ncbi:MAG: tetratricopeptide repeat protein [Candidatus Saliniplasma sp.]
MHLNKGRYRILIHLEIQMDSVGFETYEKVPYSICQNGIAEAVNLSRSRTSEIIRDMIEDDLVEENVRRVVGLKRRRKVYSLTRKGLKKVKEVKDRLGNKKVTVKRESAEYEVELEKIDTFIDSRKPLLIALNNLNEDDVIDLRASEKKRKEVFVGRSDEINYLLKILEKSNSNEPSTVLIKGKAGIGKTRLVNEFREKTLSENVIFLDGKAYYESSEPYLPFKEAFKDLERKSEPLQFSNRHLDESEDSRFYEEELDNTRDLVFSETAENIKSLAEDKAMAVFIDDLQWADKASLVLFHYLSDKLRETQVMLIGAYRPEDIDDKDFLKEVIQRMRRQHLFEEIELEPLKVEDTKEIIQGLIDRVDVPNDFVKMIHDSSEGNPLFVEEFVKQMLDDEILDPKNNKFPTKKDDVEIPKVINEIIDRRIKRLSKQNLRVLQIGSIIGEEIPFSLLISVSGMDSFDLLEYVDTLTGTGIWGVESDEDMYYFNHGLIHLTVYEGIPDQLRKEIHGKVALSMEDVFEGDIEDHYSDIAYHFKEARKYNKSVDYYFKAGKRAEDVYAYEDAVEMYDEALKLSEKRSRWKILEKLGDVHRVVGKYDDSLEYYKEIIKKDLGKNVQQRIYRKEAQVYESEGRFDEAVNIIKEGLSDVYEKNVETCRLFSKKGLAEMRQGKYEMALDDFKEALETCKDFGGDREYADIYLGLGNIYFYMGEIDKSIKYLDRALDKWEQVGNRRGKSSTLNSLGIVHLNKGNLDKALEYYEKSLDIRKQRKEKRDIFSTLTNIGTIYLRKGELEKAFDHYNDSLKVWKEIGDKQGIVISLINLTEYHIKMGELDKALQKQTKSLEICRAINFKKGEAAGLSNIGAIYLKKGDLKKSKEKYERCLELCEDIGYRSLLPDPLRALSEINILEGDLDESLKNVKKALKISKDMDADLKESVSHRILGMVYREMGKNDKAKKEFEKCRDMLEDVGDRPELAELYYQYSILLHQMGEKQNGNKMMETAHSMFEEMGMKLDEEKTKKMLNS